ncbi:fibronectin type III domain-containing protein [bacterium]|nr:fibronectin type III domain-containing protein [bacterium]
MNDVSNTLTVDWEVLGDTEQFRVFYALSGENLENSVDVTGHTVVFENLDVTKEYQFQVVPLV